MILTLIQNWFCPHSNAKWLVIICLMSLPFSAKAQKENNANVLSWYQYKGEVLLKNRFSVVFDLQHRRQDLVNFSSQQVVRPGLAYTLKSNVKLTLGTALFWHNINKSNNIYRFEARPYVFAEWKQALGKIQVIHRSRFELRYNKKTNGSEIVNGYNFNYRAGHKLGLSIPIISQSDQKWHVEVYDEVLVNFGKRILRNYLDQNRVYAGLRKTMSTKMSLKLGYMYVFVPSSNSTDFVTQHIFVLGISQKL